jgi:hypothetical protein
MNLHKVATPITASYDGHHQADTRLHGRWLLLARIVWFALVAFTLSVYMASMPAYVTELQTVCRQAFCSFAQLSPEMVVALEHAGLSVSSYTSFMVALATILALVFFGTAGLIFWRKSDDWMALLVALLAVEAGTIPVLFTVTTSHSATPVQLLFWVLFNITYFLAFTLFPDGRFVPRWTRWLFVVSSVDTVILLYFTNPFTGPPKPIGLAVVLLLMSMLVSLTIAQVYRYRYVSTLVQRQQTKWVVYGLSANLVWYVAALTPALIFRGTLFPLVFTLVYYCTLFPYPLSISFAILRYRLWEIDVIIRRTLVYSTLTVMLALIYFGLVIGLESLVRLLTGQVSPSPVVIVASTLAIAALFQPLRRRIQFIIDRRFYRRKYDAARVVEAFSTTLRHEVDLTQLREHLLNVVQETMQPVHVSLWLRKSDHKRKPNSPM